MQSFSSINYGSLLVSVADNHPSFLQLTPLLLFIKKFSEEAYKRTDKEKHTVAIIIQLSERVFAVCHT